MAHLCEVIRFRMTGMREELETFRTYYREKESRDEVCEFVNHISDGNLEHCKK